MNMSDASDDDDDAAAAWSCVPGFCCLNMAPAAFETKQLNCDKLTGDDDEARNAKAQGNYLFMHIHSFETKSYDLLALAWRGHNSTFIIQTKKPDAVKMSVFCVFWDCVEIDPRNWCHLHLKSMRIHGLE